MLGATTMPMRCATSAILSPGPAPKPGRADHHLHLQHVARGQMPERAFRAREVDQHIGAGQGPLDVVADHDTARRADEFARVAPKERACRGARAPPRAAHPAPASRSRSGLLPMRPEAPAMATRSMEVVRSNGARKHVQRGAAHRRGVVVHADDLLHAGGDRIGDRLARRRRGRRLRFRGLGSGRGWRPPRWRPGAGPAPRSPADAVDPPVLRLPRAADVAPHPCRALLRAGRGRRAGLGRRARHGCVVVGAEHLLHRLRHAVEHALARSRRRRGTDRRHRARGRRRIPARRCGRRRVHVHADRRLERIHHPARRRRRRRRPVARSLRLSRRSRALRFDPLRCRRRGRRPRRETAAAVALREREPLGARHRVVARGGRARNRVGRCATAVARRHPPRRQPSAPGQSQPPTREAAPREQHSVVPGAASDLETEPLLDRVGEAACLLWRRRVAGAGCAAWALEFRLGVGPESSAVGCRGSRPPPQRRRRRPLLLHRCPMRQPRGRAALRARAAGRWRAVACSPKGAGFGAAAGAAGAAGWRRSRQNRPGLRRRWGRLGGGGKPAAPPAAEPGVPGTRAPSGSGQLAVALDLLDRRLGILELREMKTLPSRRTSRSPSNTAVTMRCSGNAAALLLAENVVPAVLVESVGDQGRDRARSAPGTCSCPGLSFATISWST